MDCNSPSIPGIILIPASFAISLERTLQPISRIADAGGPNHATFLFLLLVLVLVLLSLPSSSSTGRSISCIDKEKSAFSLKNPYPNKDKDNRQRREREIERERERERLSYFDTKVYVMLFFNERKNVPFALRYVLRYYVSIKQSYKSFLPGCTASDLVTCIAVII